MRSLVAIAALVASLEVYAGHWADQNGQCLDEGGEPTACKWGQMYWGDGQTYSPPISVNATLCFSFGNFKTSAVKTPLQIA